MLIRTIIFIAAFLSFAYADTKSANQDTSPDEINVRFPVFLCGDSKFLSLRIFETANAVSSAEETRTTSSPTTEPIALAKYG